MKDRKVDENTEVYALIIKQVNVMMTHVCTKVDDSTILSRYNYQLLQTVQIYGSENKRLSKKVKRCQKVVDHSEGRGGGGRGGGA